MQTMPTLIQAKRIIIALPTAKPMLIDVWGVVITKVQILAPGVMELEAFNSVRSLCIWELGVLPKGLR